MVSGLRINIFIMKFTAQNPKENILTLTRKLGYRPVSRMEKELSCVRYLMGREYPRFHLYIRKNKEKDGLSFSLHLDQRKPSYFGNRAHGGEHTGEVVTREVERIKKIIKEIN